MDGARLILNARYFHIAQTGEKATKYAFVAEAAAGLVNYIATRESVIYNYDEHYKEVTATEAQREAINQFLEVSPDLELSREFKAYDEDRSAANASALISRAAQYVYGMTAEGDVKPSAPATRAQRERIQEFVNKVPAIRQTPEYSDYKASPTRENASEVLSHALEVGLANAADPETLEIMLNYIAERPGVVHNEGKVHGLFTVNGAADLAAEKEAIAAHTGNIYSMVFSLRREDADRLGYDRQDAWSQLFAIKADKIAQALRVPTSKLHWVAAVHNTKHHPHAHFIAYSTEQKSRIYLSEDAIEQLKSEFVSEIFAEERHQIFAPREEARQQLEDRLETLFTQLEHNSNAAVTDLLLPEKLAALRKSIESASGRHVYKYLPKGTKAMVDKLLDEISEVPEIKELLTEYNKYQQQLEAYYKTPDEPKPLSAATTRSNLYPLKNLVVQYALQFEPSPPLTPKTENSSAKTGSTSGFSYSDALDEPENAQMNEPFKATWKTNDIRSWRDNMKVQSSSPPYDGTAEEKYRYAQYLRYDEKCPQDAILWYNLAEQLGHTEAAYQLAQYYLKKGEDQDVELGNYYLLKAKLGFEDTLLDSVNTMQLQAISAGNTYADAIADFGPLEAEEKKQQRAISRAAYFLGRIYTTGIEIANIDGIESEDLPALQVATDPHKAAAYFEFAYRSGYKHAAYYLGNLYFHGKLSPADKPDYERAAGWYMANTENPYCQFALAKMIEHGQGFTPNVETAETLYRKCLNANDYLTAESSYAIAQIYLLSQPPCPACLPSSTQSQKTFSARIPKSQSQTSTRKKLPYSSHSQKKTPQNTYWSPFFLARSSMKPSSMQMNAQKKISLHAAFISSPMNSAFFLIWATFSACSALRDPVTLLSCPASSHRHSSDRPTVQTARLLFETAARPLFSVAFPPCPIPPLPSASCLETRRSLPVPFQPTTGKAAAFLVVDQIAAAAST